ncbi:MAG: hypothetical protein C0507_10285 [Cyanobacteria bacterium PR.3.49]|nr:hypothetical protein [Cyanobacteria bacterium PR.3.49]
MESGTFISNRLASQIMLLALAPFLCALIVLIILGCFSQNIEEAQTREKAAQAALQDSFVLCQSLLDSIYQVTEYSINAGEGSLDRFITAREQMPNKFAAMKAAAVGDKELTAIVDELLACGKLLVRLTDESIGLSQIAPKDVCEARMAENHSLLRILVLHVSGLITDYAAGLEERIRSSPAGSFAARQKLLQLSAFGIAAVIALTVLAAALLTKNVSNRLSTVAANCELVAKGERPRVPMEGDDEISEIDRAFHAMHSQLLLTRSRETAAVNHSANVIMTLSDKLFIEKVNDAIQKLWGYKPNDVIGENITAYLETDELEHVPDQFRSARKAESGNFETFVRTADGKQSANFWTVTWSEPQEKFFLVAQDITELKELEEKLKESERRMQLIFARMPAGLMLVATGVEFVNTQAENILGYSPGQLAGVPVKDVLPGDGLQRLQQSEGPIEVEFRSASAESMIMEAVARRLNEGQILIILADSREKNALKQARQRLSSLIVDDIEQPLKDISQSFQILCEKFGDDAQLAKPVNRLAREAARLVRLFGELVNTGAPEMENLTVNSAIVEIHEIALDAVSAAQDLAAARAVRITCDCRAGFVMADPDRIRQILTNLLSNAIKFAPQDSIIAVSGKIQGERYLLSVCDQGPGIPNELEELIFMPFKQVKRSDAYKLGGSGMGLSICRQLAKQMDGELSVQNNSDAGCTFTLTLRTSSATHPTAS